MPSKYKWLLLPPAIALLLFLGPLANTGAAPAKSPATPAVAATATPAVPASTLPSAPSFTQIASTLAGVLLLGVAVVLGLARLSKRPRAGGGELLALRDCLRLSGKHAVYVVEFDDRLLLLGECDGSLRTLHSGAGPIAAAGESGESIEDPEDTDGAVPRDLLIPKPAARRPKPPRTTAAKATAADAQIADFRKLLQLARASVGAEK